MGNNGSALETTYEQWRLPNGLGVVVAYQPWLKTFAAILSFNVGWCDEPKPYHGLTHLLEHLAFNGPNQAIVERLAEEGVYLNGTTEWEQTLFLASGHASLIEAVFEFYANVLRGCAISGPVVRSELEIIGQELLTYQESPSEFEKRRITAEILGDPALARPYLQITRGLRRLPMDTIISYAKTRFSLDTALLTLVCPTPPEALKDQIARQLSLPAAEGRLESPPSKSIRAFNRLIARNYHGPQTLVALAHAYGPRDLYPLAVVAMLNQLLGGGPHSLLYRRIRRDAQLGYEVASTIIALRQSVLIESYAIVHRRHSIKALQSMLEIQQALRASGLTEDVFEQNRRSMLRAIEAIQDNPQELCSWLAHEAVTARDDQPISPKRYLEQLQNVTLMETNRIAAEVFSPQRRTTIIMGSFGPLKRMRARALVNRYGG